MAEKSTYTKEDKRNGKSICIYLFYFPQNSKQENNNLTPCPPTIQMVHMEFNLRSLIGAPLSPTTKFLLSNPTLYMDMNCILLNAF